MSTQTELNSRLLECFEAHREFSRVLIDAYVVVNKEYEVLKFNSAFCQLVDLKAVDVKKMVHLEKMLTTKITGSESSVLEQLLISCSPTRIDEVSALTLSEQSLTLIMSSYPYCNDSGEILGAFILMRNVTAENNLQTKYKDKSLESITDTLTGLYIRRYFEAAIDKEIAKNSVKNTNVNLAILMLDLDKFKTINDTYGHQAGDYVLVETARLLKSSARRSDIVGRFGGEEMLAAIFDTNEKTATIVAEKFRTAIEKFDYNFEGKKIPVTVSIGVTLIVNPNDTKEAAVKRADACLYHAKETGRNRSVVDFGNGPTLARDFLS